MALTQSAWISKTVNGALVSTCTVVQTTAENDAYTLKTPKELDTTRPFLLSVQASATPDGVAVPFDIWVGYGEDFALTGNDSTVAATSGAKFKQIFDDIVLAVTPLVYTFLIDPYLPVADVVTVAAIATGPKVRVPSAPYYVFNLNGGSTLNAATMTFTIAQPAVDRRLNSNV
jgi:hypothetical protein